MKKQDPNPYAYGYARMPRIIRKGYKNLTNMQKLLYIYLRDLCGEEGTCYRSLRSLKEETGFSIGYLSVAIPVLHNEGLIHAAMAKTHSTHWAVWHISVVDIWEKNALFLQSEHDKCSPDEQLVEQSVQDMNRSVHQMNRIDESVQEVNESVHAMILNKNQDRELTITENKEEESTIDASASTRTQSENVIPFENGLQKKITDNNLKAVPLSHSQRLSEEETVPRMPVVKGQGHEQHISPDALPDNHAAPAHNRAIGLDEPPLAKGQVDDGSIHHSDLRGDHPAHPAGMRNPEHAERAGAPEALEALGRLEKGQAHVDYSGDTRVPEHSDILLGTLQGSGRQQGRLEQIGANNVTTHNMLNGIGIDTGTDRDVPHTQLPSGHQKGVEDTQQQEVDEQKPGAGGIHFSPADTPPGVGTGDATGVQAPIPGEWSVTPAQQAGAVLDISVKAGAAQVVPKRPRPRKPPVYLELTLQGAAVKVWYEEARGCKLRMSSGNVAACNSLGDNEDVAEVSLKATIKHLDNIPWVIEHEYAIDIQVLADDKSRLNFEKNWPLVKRKLERAGAHKDEDYSDFDKYVGNGKEERAARHILYKEMEARGELIS